MPHRRDRLSVLLTAACVAWIAGVGLWAWPFTVDDAYIVAGYAQHLYADGSYSLDGVRRSDGVTGPLWLAPFVWAHVCGASPLLFAKSTGLLCMCAGVVWMLSGLQQRQGGRWLASIAALVCACQSDVAIWAIGGLETGAATGLMVLSACAVAKPRMRLRDHGALGTALALLAWLRPEAALFAAVLLIGAWSRDRRGAIWATGLAMFGALSVLAFRMTMFGHLWPLSAIAKPAELAQGASYVWTGLVLITGVVGAPLFVHGMRVGRVTDRWVGTAVLAHVVAVMLAGGDWMPGFRLLTPIVPLYAWVVAVGVVRLRRRWLGVGLAGLSALLPLISLVVQVPEARASGSDRERGGAMLAQWLQAHACHVALVDVGYLPYASGVTVVDLAGVTDETFARLPGGHVNKRIPVQQLLERAPDTLVLRGKQERSLDRWAPRDVQWLSGTEHRLAHSAEIASRYRLVNVVRYADAYVYYVLQAAQGSDGTAGAQRCSRR